MLCSDITSASFGAAYCGSYQYMIPNSMLSDINAPMRFQSHVQYCKQKSQECTRTLLTWYRESLSLTVDNFHSTHKDGGTFMTLLLFIQSKCQSMQCKSGKIYHAHFPRLHYLSLSLSPSSLLPLLPSPTHSHIHCLKKSLQHTFVMMSKTYALLYLTTIKC